MGDCGDRRGLDRLLPTSTDRGRIYFMAATSWSDLLNLPPRERADLAVALWESLSDEQRAAGLPLGSEQAAELDRRWAAHVANPASAIPWEDVRRKLQG